MNRLIASPDPAAAMAFPALAGDELKPRDLTPVTWMRAPAHPPVGLVREGRTRAVVFVADRDPSASLKGLLDESVEVVRLSTGAPAHGDRSRLGRATSL